jgi:hypothetical protein
MTDMTTPGAGEGERWETVEYKNGAYSFWSVVSMPMNRQVAQCLTEADADLIVRLHNERATTEDSSVVQAREADQQTIADLREERVAHLQIIKDELQNREWFEQTIAELRKALDAVVAVADKGPGVLAEIQLMPRKLQDARLKEHNHESDAAIALARKALAAIAATEEPHDRVGGLMSIPAYKAPEAK